MMVLIVYYEFLLLQTCSEACRDSKSAEQAGNCSVNSSVSTLTGRSENDSAGNC